MSFLLAFIVAVSTPCPAEDSTGCYWDAQHRGNGQGRSFVVVDHDPAPVVIYLPGGAR